PSAASGVVTPSRSAISGASAPRSWLLTISCRRKTSVSDMLPNSDRDPVAAASVASVADRAGLLGETHSAPPRSPRQTAESGRIAGNPLMKWRRIGMSKIQPATPATPIASVIAPATLAIVARIRSASADRPSLANSPKDLEPLSMAGETRTLRRVPSRSKKTVANLGVAPPTQKSGTDTDLAKSGTDTDFRKSGPVPDLRRSAPD